jgi:hypothetical protein
LVGKLHDQAVLDGRSELAKSWARRGREFEREAGIIGQAIKRLDQMAA